MIKLFCNFSLLIISALIAQGTTQSLQAGRNHLGSEKSPYLLQHKDNPVWWYAWGEKAFAAAKKQGKPIFLSVGYATCHWCHVMEHESFENKEVADYLNKHFIAIKVDREERPDIDGIYMDALHAMGQNGGWPMSVIMTPERKPFFGGTYFPKARFLLVLGKLNKAWKGDRKRIDEVSQNIINHLRSSATHAAIKNLNERTMIDLFLNAEKRFDSTFGGFGNAPKFPPTMQLRMLMRIFRRTGEISALHMVETTLSHMARGGIYDHVGGGFARYSTDAKWLVPHFEKMLYDNANLATTYIEAWQITKKDLYRDVATDIFTYILRDMTAKNGGFYSAEDADSEGEEGKFYVWKENELKQLLGKIYPEFSKWYGTTSQGNFEHNSNILHITTKVPWKTIQSTRAKELRKKLFNARKKRPQPLKDDKQLASWNGLMIDALARGAQAFDHGDTYLRAAQAAATFITTTLVDAKETGKNPYLYRRYRDGERRFFATLDDYAFVIQGLISLYETDFNLQWIDWAQRLQAQQDKRFWDENNSGYFYSDAGAKGLLIRRKTFNDTALPNANGVAALNLIRLYSLTLEKTYLERSRQTIAAVGKDIQRVPAAYTQLLIALDFHLDSAKEVAIIGDPSDKHSAQLLKSLRQNFLPNKVVAMANNGKKTTVAIMEYKQKIRGQTTAYVCEGFSCKLPTSKVKKMMSLVSSNKTYTITKK